MFETIFTKFESIREELCPEFILLDEELQFIIKNKIDFTNEILEKYTSSDIKRFFIMIPQFWVHYTKSDLIRNLKKIEKINTIDSVYGFLLFFHKIVGVDILRFIKEEIKYKNEDLNGYLFDNYEVLEANLEFDRSELKFLNIDSNLFNTFRLSLIEEGIPVLKRNFWDRWFG